MYFFVLHVKSYCLFFVSRELSVIKGWKSSSPSLSKWITLNFPNMAPLTWLQGHMLTNFKFPLSNQWKGLNRSLEGSFNRIHFQSKM